MQIIKTIGYILERKPHKKFDEIVIIFSKDLGKIEVLAKGLRKPNSKLSSTLNLFNEVEVILTKKAERFILKTVFLLKEVNFRNFTQGLSFFYLREVLNESFPLESPEEKIYYLFHSVIKEISHNKNINNILNNFNKKFLIYSGLAPDSLFDKNYDKIIKNVSKKSLIYKRLIFEFSRPN